jgi:hypothetical protein
LAEVDVEGALRALHLSQEIEGDLILLTGSDPGFAFAALSIEEGDGGT